MSAMKGHEILLCDLDAFFASVEQRDHPEYRGKPVIVGGRPDRRGVVAACSYEARKYGVHSGMPISRAEKLCPDAVFLPVDIERYRCVSAKVFAIYERFTAQIEKVSIDEAYLALPPEKGFETAQKIRKTVKQELGLPISAGVSVNKLLAKMACELAKPDGIKMLRLEDVPKEIWPLPVKELPGVGPHTEKKLKQAGVKTIGQLAKFPKNRIIKMLGSVGESIHEFANGIDTRAIETEQEPKSIGEETTFPKDVYDREKALTTLLELTEQVGCRLRRKKLMGRTVTIKIRFGDFRTITRSRTLEEAVDADGTIYRIARELFLSNCSKPPWRLVGVQVSNLDKGSYEQVSLFSSIEKKERQLSKVIDEIRERYGRDAVKRATLISRKESSEQKRL